MVRILHEWFARGFFHKTRKSTDSTQFVIHIGGENQIIVFIPDAKLTSMQCFSFAFRFETSLSPQVGLFLFSPSSNRGLILKMHISSC